MKTTMKKTVAYLLALLLVIQMVPAFAGTTYSGVYIQRGVTYRDAIEITPGLDIDILKVGMENQLSVSSDYKNIAWESDHPEIATVDEDGLVTAVSEGKVTITVVSEGKYKDTISFKVIAETKAEEPDAEPETQTEELQAEMDEPDEAQASEEKIIIFIKGNKTKTEYDGTVQKNTYTVTTSNDALFDESRLTMKDDHLAEEQNCGVWQDTMTEDDFVYDGNAEIVVSNGWMQIKPKAITIKADDIEVDEGAKPSYTATVTEGLVAGETLDLSTIEFTEIEQDGETYIQPDIQKGQVLGNYRIESVLAGKLTVNKAAENAQNLYNFLKMDKDNNYYRLKITSINADPLEKIGNGKTLNADQYSIPGGEYDFSNLILTVGDEEYRFSATRPEGDFESCYTIDSVKVTTNNRITGQDAWFNNSAGYLDDSETQYKSMGIKRTQAGFHRDYFVTLHEGRKIAHEEPTEEPVEKPMSIRVKSSWPKDTPAYAGTPITLTAELIGFEGKQYTLQWQHSTDHQNWVDVPGANGTSFTYELNIETTEYYWRVVAIDAE